MKRFSAKLAVMPVRLEAAMAEAMASAAIRTVGEARGIAPVDSGALRAGISARQSGRLAAAAVSAAPHAAMVEYGTSRMKPRPYMLPAARSAENGYFEDARRAAGEVLK